MMETTEPIKDAEGVRRFAAILNADLDHCDNGEGMECASLEASLGRYACLCSMLSEHIKRWGQEVFTGHTSYQQSVDEAWFEAGVALNNRAVEMLERAQLMEIVCYDLAAADKLRSALFGLYQLLDGWVSPHLSIGPSARQAHQSLNNIEAVRNNIAELRPLPQGWLPTDARQLGVFRKASKT